MSDVKSKFTLHTQYKEFVPQQTEIDFDTLSPNISSFLGCFVSLTVALLMGSIAVCFGLGSVSVFAMDQQYNKDGLPITAQILSCRMDQQPKAGTKPLVTYSYIISEMTYTGTHRFEGTSCSPYPEAAALPAVYLPSEPEKARVAGTSDRTIVYLAVGGVGLFCLVLSLAVFQDLRRFSYAKHNQDFLKTNGILLEGEITSISGHKPSNGGSYSVTVQYCFETPQKKVLTGSGRANRDDLKDQELPSVGTPVTVLYADDNGYMML